MSGAEEGRRGEGSGGRRLTELVVVDDGAAFVSLLLGGGKLKVTDHPALGGGETKVG